MLARHEGRALYRRISCCITCSNSWLPTADELHYRPNVYVFELPKCMAVLAQYMKQPCLSCPGGYRHSLSRYNLKGRETSLVHQPLQ